MSEEKKQKLKEYQQKMLKNTEKQKSLNTIMNKVVFNNDLNKLTEIKV